MESVDGRQRTGIDPVGGRTAGFARGNAAGSGQRSSHDHQCRACEQNSDRLTHRSRNPLDTNPLDHLSDDFPINSKGATTVTGSRMWQNFYEITAKICTCGIIPSSGFPELTVLSVLNEVSAQHYLKLCRANAEAIERAPL